MTESFEALSARAKATWSQDTDALYEAASQAFKAEMDQQQETESGSDQ